jgi:hypothetical protein
MRLDILVTDVSIPDVSSSGIIKSTGKDRKVSSSSLEMRSSSTATAEHHHVDMPRFNTHGTNVPRTLG